MPLLEIDGRITTFSDKAMPFLMMLYDQNVAEAYTLVYHNTHPEPFIMKLEIADGLPIFPFKCSVCGGIISDICNTSYEFLFVVKMDWLPDEYEPEPEDEVIAKSGVIPELIEQARKSAQDCEEVKIACRPTSLDSSCGPGNDVDIDTDTSSSNFWKSN